MVDAAVDAAETDTIHVGNAFGQLFNGQGHLAKDPLVPCSAACFTHARLRKVRGSA